MPINFVHMQDVKSQEAEPTEQSAAILESETKSIIWNWNGPKSQSRLTANFSIPQLTDKHGEKCMIG